MTLLATLVEVRRAAQYRCRPADGQRRRRRRRTRPAARSASHGKAPDPGRNLYRAPGDSLAGDLYRYYGETLKYTAIFAASNKLESPDKIRIRQSFGDPGALSTAVWQGRN
ncbi:MAG: hypothetical protein R3D85_06150 [Paracoccaceae bacterium]